MRGAVMDDSYRIGPRAATAVVGQTAHRVVPEIFFTTRRVACVAMLTTAVRGARHVTRIAISRTIRYRSCGPMPPSTVVTARDRILTGMVTTVRSRITDQTGEPIRFPMGGSTDLSAARVAPRHVTHRSACTIWLPVRANARYRAGVVTCCAAPQRIPLNITAAVSPPVRRDTRHTMQFGMGNAACNATRARARQPVGRTACCVRERLAEVAPPNASHQAFCQKRVPLRNLQHTRMALESAQTRRSARRALRITPRGVWACTWPPDCFCRWMDLRRAVLRGAVRSETPASMKLLHRASAPMG